MLRRTNIFDEILSQALDFEERALVERKVFREYSIDIILSSFKARLDGVSGIGREICSNTNSFCDDNSHDSYWIYSTDRVGWPISNEL